jgi:hypothetical protein
MLGAINFITTILNMRSPGIRLHKNKQNIFANLCIRAKFRGSPKALITKDIKETL